MAVHNLSIQNPNTTNITYFDPGVVKPTWWTTNNNDITASGSNCYYAPSGAAQLNFPGTNPPSTAYNQIKWDEKFTVYYKIQNNPCGGTFTYLVKGADVSDIKIDGNGINTAVTSLNLNSGIHTFVVSNSTCSFTFQFNIIGPIPLSWVNVIGQNPLCTNSQTGSINVSASGGTGTINYSINSPSGQFANLFAGTYVVTATDANGCTLTSSVTLTDPPALTGINITATNPLCTNSQTGSINVSASGGTGTINYSINSPSGQFINLLAGTYVVTATDANGCTLTSSITLTDPPALTGINITATNPLCTNSQTGSINVSASGGTGTINYSINSPSGSFTNLFAGTYVVTATDANGCTLTSSVTLTDPPSLNWSSITTTNPSCTPGNNGIIIPLTTGGTGQVSFTPRC
ncbi:MAG: SprB repeat-containing protein [Bacteroidota bacterium]|nr:MAG: SprB repeat-containing protein [Bacteroidota bacterium]